MANIIYCDHSATTPVKKEVLNEMLPYFCNNYGNASATYSIGRISRIAIEKSREKVSKAIKCNANEIYFTSSGSEADNMIILGIARANKNKGKHIITSKIEHLAVLNTCRELEKEGFEVTYLDVDSNGMIDLNKLKSAIRCDTILISIMFANNELGTIEPIEEIGKIAKEHNILFHTDAVQAIGNVDINVEDLKVDALSMSAHKFYGPKGIGAAFIRSGINFDPVIIGGHQEHCKRAGTENVAGIVGLSKAIELATSNIYEHNKKVSMLRDILLNKIVNGIKGVKVNANIKNKLPGNISISFDSIDAKNLLLMLDMNYICVSSGSACNSEVKSPSHVLKAIGLDDKEALSTIRITLGEENTIQEINYVAFILETVVAKLRKE